MGEGELGRAARAGGGLKNIRVLQPHLPLTVVKFTSDTMLFTAQSQLLSLTWIYPMTRFRPRAPRALFTLCALLLCLAAPGAQAQGRSAQAGEITLDLGGGAQGSALRLRGVTATGTALGDADLAAMFAPQNAAEFARRMEAFTADALTVGEARLFRKNFPDVALLTLRDLRLDAVAAGRAASFSAPAAELTNTSSVGAPDAVKGRFGALRGETLDLGLLARFLVSARASEAEPPGVFIGRLVWDGLERADTRVDETLKVGAVTLSALTLRRQKTPVADYLSSLGAAPADPAAQAPQIRAALDLAACCTIGAVESGGFTYTGEKLIVAVRSILLRGLGEWKIAELKVEGTRIEESIPKLVFKIEIGRYGFEGLDATETGEYLRGHAGDGAKFFADLNPRGLSPAFDTTEIAGVSVDFPTPKGDGNAEDGARVRASLARLAMRNTSPAAGQARSQQIAVEHLSFALPKGPDEVWRALDAMGYGVFDFSGGSRTEFDPGRRSLDLRRFGGAVPGMGGVYLDLGFGDVSPDLLGASKAAMTSALLQLTFREARLRVENGGLFEKLLAWRAGRAGLSQDAVKAEWRALAERTLAQALPAPGALKQPLAELDVFMRAPIALEITVSAPKPVPAIAYFSAHSRPEQWFDALRLSAKAAR